MQLRWYQQEAVDAAFLDMCTQAGNSVTCLPTGAGKSVVIAEIARRAVMDYRGRVLILQHRKELIEQNLEKVQKFLPIKIGSYSAGLRRYATEEDVVLCGIQSVYSKASVFGSRNLLLIDEAHLVSSNTESMFGTFISDLRQINPKLRIHGLTATPYRTGEGSLCRADAIFQRISFNAPIQRLIEEGYLSKVTNKVAEGSFDTSGLHKRAGEFISSEMEQLFSDAGATLRACKEIVAKAVGRKSCLLFCSGVYHAETVKRIIEELTGETCGIVTGETADMFRASMLADFKNQTLRWLVNCDVLTTGFDAPCVDLLAIIRATASPGLFAQMVGRGLRTADGKLDCLVLDFGENIKRHGPIDAIDFGKVKQSRESDGSEGPTKLCPSCEEQVAVSRLTCECGFKWPAREPNNGDAADEASQIISEPETFNVEDVTYAVHQKKDKPDAPPTMRVTYHCSRGDGNITEKIQEWICIEHEGFARRNAEKWWTDHSIYGFPDCVESAVEWCERGYVAKPRNIVARREGKWWRIVSREIEELPVVDENTVVEELPF
jgi:DNA repair protein RadD